MKQNKTYTIVYNSIFIVISMILGFFGRLSILPVFPFLKLDFSDIPAFLITTIYGFSSGATVLVVSSILRTLMFSSAGWLGFAIRCTSLIMIFFLHHFVFNKEKKFYRVCGIILGILTCVTIKLIINWFIWTNFFNISAETLNKLMLSVIIPYNILKLIITVCGALALIKPIKNIIKLSKA